MTGMLHSFLKKRTPQCRPVICCCIKVYPQFSGVYLQWVRRKASASGATYTRFSGALTAFLTKTTHTSQEAVDEATDAEMKLTPGLAHPFGSLMFLGADNAGDMVPSRALRRKYSAPRRDVRPPEASAHPLPVEWACKVPIAFQVALIWSNVGFSGSERHTPRPSPM